MQILQIKAGKSINPNTGDEWYKADVLVSVGDDENPDEIFKQVKQRIDGWLPNPFKEIQIREQKTPEPIPEIKVEKQTKASRIEMMKTEISLSGSIRELETFAPLVKTYPELQQAYDYRMSKFKN